MRRIAISNLKGGTSKTVTAVALATILAQRGHRTLLVDCDGQGNASWTLLAGQPAVPPTLGGVLLRDAAADEAIRPTAVPGLDLLPADTSLSGANVALIQEVGRDARLRQALTPLEGRWDFVILDTAPTITCVLANALVFAGEVIAPMDRGLYAMIGLVELQATIEAVRDAYNPELRLAGLLLTRMTRNNVTRDIERGLREKYGPLVYQTTIPESVKIEEATTRGMTIATYAPLSAGAKAYELFADEVLADGSANKRGRKRDGRGTGTGAAA